MWSQQIILLLRRSIELPVGATFPSEFSQEKNACCVQFVCSVCVLTLDAFLSRHGLHFYPKPPKEVRCAIVHSTERRSEGKGEQKAVPVPVVMPAERTLLFEFTSGESADLPSLSCHSFLLVLYSHCTVAVKKRERKGRNRKRKGSRIVLQCDKKKKSKRTKTRVSSLLNANCTLQ